MSEIRACVIGHPVAHSRSPLIHKYWLAVHGIRGDYTREDVPPEKIEAFLDGFANGPYAGASVTVPHKEVAFRKVAEADDVARALGVANLLWCENGKLFGGNTDVHGFLANLTRTQPNWQANVKNAVVIGAGGAARAAVYGLLKRGIGKITIANRTLARATELATLFANKPASVALSELAPQLEAADLLVNTTSLGMKGQPPLVLDLAPLKKSAIVYDIVYAPLETELLAKARARGNPAVDGLGMLLHQAAPAFERWFGVRPEVTSELRALVIADLAREAAR
jgi:shikimate dehydrogenase